MALATTTETSRPRFVNCTFSGGGDTGYEACVEFDSGVDEPIFTGCSFPADTMTPGGRTLLDAGGAYKAWENYNLSDTALAT